DTAGRVAAVVEHETHVILVRPHHCWQVDVGIGVREIEHACLHMIGAIDPLRVMRRLSRKLRLQLCPENAVTWSGDCRRQRKVEVTSLEVYLRCPKSSDKCETAPRLARGDW